MFRHYYVNKAIECLINLQNLLRDEDEEREQLE